MLVTESTEKKASKRIKTNRFRNSMFRKHLPFLSNFMRLASLERGGGVGGSGGTTHESSRKPDRKFDWRRRLTFSAPWNKNAANFGAENRLFYSGYRKSVCDSRLLLFFRRPSVDRQHASQNTLAPELIDSSSEEKQNWRSLLLALAQNFRFKRFFLLFFTRNR